MTRTSGNPKRQRVIADASSSTSRRAAVVLYACLGSIADITHGLSAARDFAAARDWRTAAEVAETDANAPLGDRPGWLRALDVVRDGRAHGIVMCVDDACSHSHADRPHLNQAIGGAHDAFLLTVSPPLGGSHG